MTLWTPRWRHQKVNVEQSATVRIDPQTFMNTTDWDLHLKWLSIAGVPEDGAAPFDSNGIGKRFQAEIGITQKGDINYTMANIGCLFGGHRGTYDGTAVHNFDPAFELAPDAGILVEIFNEDTGTYDIKNPGVVINGVRKEKYFDGLVPAQLAGYEDATITPGNSVTIGSTDLFNNGEEPMFLRQLVLPGAVMEDGVSAISIDPSLSKVRCRINPNSGVEWMPDPHPIPVGCVAPFSTYWNDNSTTRAPEVYRFPQGTILRPRQRVMVELTNLATGAQPDTHLCLYGLLEVR